MPPRKKVEPTEILSVGKNQDELAKTARQLIENMPDEEEPTPPAYTVVPYQFSRMPDAVLSIAMQTYSASKDAGKSDEDATTDGVAAAKGWARDHGVDYRK